QPRSDMLPITADAESAEAMTNAASSSIAMVDTPGPKGYSCRALNSILSASPSPQTDLPVTARSIAVPPKMEKHRIVTEVGTSRITMMNSRTVRPREIRARNIPTNGDQETHHAQ